MADVVTASFPSGTGFESPEGGLFLWVELPRGLDTLALLTTAVTRHRVAYVPGAPFFVERPRSNTLRLNFSNCQPAAIVDGVSSLGALFTEALGAGADQPTAL